MEECGSHLICQRCGHYHMDQQQGAFDGGAFSRDAIYQYLPAARGCSGVCMNLVLSEHMYYLRLHHFTQASFF
jgi:hypothetical protein